MATQLTLNDGSLNSAGSLLLKTNGTTTAVTIDTSQNLGLGVTPNTWRTNDKVMQIGGGTNYTGFVGAGAGVVYGNNFYRDSGGFKYTQSYSAGRFDFDYTAGGGFTWNIAPSGTAGNAITFTQAMTLDASGKLLVGATSSIGSCNAQFNDSNGQAALFNSSSASGAYAGWYNSGSARGFIGSAAQLIGAASANNFAVRAEGDLLFATSSFERARIDSSGNLLVGVTSGGNTLTSKSRSGNRAFSFINSSDQNIFYTSSNTAMSSGENGANAAGYFGKDSGTSRSINAAGTINASGADYAEYMTKDGDFTVAKGDVVGINAEGKLTNVFANAVSFVVKSTDPSYVGGDVWGNEEAVGLVNPDTPHSNATEEEKAQYETDKAAFEFALEAARQKVDRIAFAGQVPVNVTGATAGQFIVPTNDNGAIIGIAVNEADMTLSQYMKAVGKVISIEQDGRAKIIVKVA